MSAGEKCSQRPMLCRGYGRANELCHTSTQINLCVPGPDQQLVDGIERVFRKGEQLLMSQMCVS